MPRGFLARRDVLLGLFGVPLLVTMNACGRATASATPGTGQPTAIAPVEPANATTSATAANSGTFLSPSPSPNAAPAAVPAPTSAPTSSPTVLPTSAPTATSGPTATATPNARATAQALNAQVPGGKWDFSRRPILLQVDNAPDARPQNGLASAYAVYETPAEGGITRFTAVLVGQPSDTILGDLRSARLVDLDLAPQWDGILIHVGASTPVENLLNSAGLLHLDLDLTANRPAAWRSAERDAPYNLYTSLARLDPFLQTHGYQLEATLPRAFPIGAVPSAIAWEAASTLDVPYDVPSTGSYTWDARSGGYLRFVNGNALTDANSGRQIVVANVVLHFARQVVTDIIEDVEGSHSLKFILVGAGRALLLRGGKQYDLTWQRGRPDELTRYHFADGSAAVFAPGNVWISFLADAVQAG